MNLGFKNMSSKLLLLLTLVSVVFLSGFSYPNGAKPSVQVKFGERVVGVVRDKETIENFISSYIRDEQLKIGKNIVPENISYEVVMAKDDEIWDFDHIFQEMEKELTLYFKGAAIIVNGKKVAELSGVDLAYKVLEEVKNKYKSKEENVKTLNLDFKENVEIEETEVSNKETVTVEEAQKILTGKDASDREYITTNIDTLKNIAVLENMELNILENANPEYKDKGISAGTVIRIPSINNRLTVVSKEEVTYSESIPNEVEKIESDQYYKGEEVVKQPGNKGLVQYTALATRENGIKTENKITEKNIVVEPEKELVIVGISEMLATGTFDNPTVGTVTSPFSERWGRFHYGLDIANTVGTLVQAADGGKVLCARAHATYGNFVEIDHENGYVTRYAHLSTIAVKEGQSIKKGEKIGQMGDTGRSTGSHLHFEVLKDKVNKDPANYVKY